MSSARSVAIVSILVPMLAACGFFEEEGPDCGCPTVDGHPQGTFESISGGRRVTITGDIVEVREPDGRTARYRFKASRTSTDERIIACGERPQANRLRTFEITSTSTSSTLHVLAEPSNRFAYVASALVPD